MYLALSLVGYDEEIKAAMAYVFGTTFVCDNMDNAKKVEIKSVFNILPLYNVGQKSWDAQLPRLRAMWYFVTPYTSSSSSSVDHWKGRGIQREAPPKHYNSPSHT